MASRRRHIFTELRTRLRTIPGFDVQFAGMPHGNPAAGVLVELWMQNEDKDYSTSDVYRNDLRVNVSIGVDRRLINNDPVPEGDEGDADLCLERHVALIEGVLHDPDDWADDPTHTYVRIDGFDFFEPTDQSLVVTRDWAILRLVFEYQSDYRSA